MCEQIVPNDSRDVSEENVWKLCHYVRESAPSDLDQYIVLFISNPAQKVGMDEVLSQLTHAITSPFYCY